MAKYTITHICGHSETVELFGKLADRDRKIAWLESKPCWDCDRAAETKRWHDVGRALGLKDITEGTEKQIAWAYSIRGRFLAKLQSQDQWPLALSIDYVNARAASVTSKFWINRRDYVTRLGRFFESVEIEDRAEDAKPDDDFLRAASKISDSYAIFAKNRGVEL